MIKAAIPYRAATKKVVKTTKAVGAGIKDYGDKRKVANAQASKNLAGTFGNSSTNIDAGRVAKETNRIMKEQGHTLRGSIRSKLGL